MSASLSTHTSHIGIHASTPTAMGVPVSTMSAVSMSVSSMRVAVTSVAVLAVGVAVVGVAVVMR